MERQYEAGNRKNAMMLLVGKGEGRPGARRKAGLCISKQQRIKYNM